MTNSACSCGHRTELRPPLTPWHDDWNQKGFNDLNKAGEFEWDNSDVPEFDLGEPLNEINYWEKTFVDQKEKSGGCTSCCGKCIRFCFEERRRVKDATALQILTDEYQQSLDHLIKENYKVIGTLAMKIRAKNKATEEIREVIAMDSKRHQELTCLINENYAVIQKLASQQKQLVPDEDEKHSQKSGVRSSFHTPKRRRDDTDDPISIKKINTIDLHQCPDPFDYTHNEITCRTSTFNSPIAVKYEQEYDIRLSIEETDDDGDKYEYEDSEDESDEDNEEMFAECSPEETQKRMKLWAHDLALDMKIKQNYAIIKTLEIDLAVDV